MRAGEDPRDVHWRKTAAVGPDGHARARARDAPRRRRSTLDAVAPARRPATSGSRAFERRIRDVASRAVAHLKRGDRVAVRHARRAASPRGDRDAVGADPLLRYLALARAGRSAPPAPVRRRPPNEVRPRPPRDDRRPRGARRARHREHGVAEPLDERRPPRRPGARHLRSRERSRAARRCATSRRSRRWSSSRSRAAASSPGASRSTSPSSSRPSSRSSASPRAAAPRTTSRSSSWRSSTSSPARCSAAASRTGSASSASSSSRPARSCSATCAARSRATTARARATAPGCPSTCPRILRSRRVVGRGFLATTCLLSVPIFLFTRVALRPLPARRAVAPAPEPPARGPHDRLLGARRSRRRRRPARRSRPSRCASRCKDLPDPPPTRLTLRLRGTAFDAYDGHAWARTQRDAIRAPDRGLDGERHVSALPQPRPVARPRRLVRSRADRSAGRLPSAARRRGAREAADADPAGRRRRRCSGAPKDELRYTGSDGRGLRYDVYLAGDREGLVELLPAAERARYLALPPDLSKRIADLAHRWTDGLPTPQEKATAIEDHLHREFTYDLHSPSSGTPEPGRPLSLRVAAAATASSSRRRWPSCSATVGIPSRNVTGFVGGTWNRFGRYYAVREGDAHSWVEAYIDDPVRPAWRTFDPTPPGGAQPLEPPGRRLLLRARLRRGAVAALGHVRRRLRPAEAGAHLRGAESSLRAHALEGRRRPRTARRLTRGPVVAGGALAPVRRSGTCVEATAQALGRADGRRGQASDRRSGSTPPRRSIEPSRPHCSFKASPEPPSIPPLRHAEELKSRSHPLADEVLSPDAGLPRDALRRRRR